MGFEKEREIERDFGWLHTVNLPLSHGIIFFISKGIFNIKPSFINVLLSCFWFI